eukprot:CAMPEP_0179053530 /NCGR_PEP_ID=MMETSP0796-20121207/22321_1 /TAXON_ID=73915 /ORGANISM="Pyrodinium bahamense, Strain pbaha01" /LENGTH=210 /DNA_ID=CAMNT_0020750131 /DNA_START=88 /DNA_END=720 /DNA_ORIENTATION=+
MGANCAACEGRDSLGPTEIFEEHMIALVPEERHSAYVPHSTTQAASKGACRKEPPLFSEVAAPPDGDQAVEDGASGEGELEVARVPNTETLAAEVDTPVAARAEPYSSAGHLARHADYGEFQMLDAASPVASPTDCGDSRAGPGEAAAVSGRPVVPPLKLPTSKYPPVPPLKLPVCPHPPLAGCYGSKHQASANLPRLMPSRTMCPAMKK